MIVLVTGGRKYRNRKEAYSILTSLHEEHGFTYLVHGDAPGLDRIARDWAFQVGVYPVAVPALWDFHGAPSAGPKRNKAMYVFARPKKVIAFPGGVGTANMMKIAYDAQKSGDDVEIIDVEDIL